MNLDFANALAILGYLVVGTVGIALFAGWALKRFGPRK
jgi:hypothetical protein